VHEIFRMIEKGAMNKKKKTKYKNYKTHKR
jgi:hypothetical protein